MTYIKTILIIKCVTLCSQGYLFSENHQYYKSYENITKSPLYHQDGEYIYECKKYYGRLHGKEEEVGFCILCIGQNYFDYTQISEIEDSDNYECNEYGSCYMKNKQSKWVCDKDYTGYIVITYNKGQR